MKKIYFAILVVLAGINCRHRGVHTSAKAQTASLSWEEIRDARKSLDSAMSDVRDRCLSLESADAPTKKKKPTRIRLENPGTGPDTIFVNQNAIQNE
jgi:hypothetical protein